MDGQCQGQKGYHSQHQQANYGEYDRYGIIGNRIRLNNNGELMDSPNAHIIVPIPPSKVYPPIPPDTFVVHSVPKIALANGNFDIPSTLARGSPVVLIASNPTASACAIPASDHNVPYSSSPLSAQPQFTSSQSNPAQSTSTLRERIVERYQIASKEEKLKALIDALRDSANDPNDLVIEALHDIAHEEHEKATAAEKKIKQLENKLEFMNAQYSSALDVLKSLRKEKNLFTRVIAELKADLKRLAENK